MEQSSVTELKGWLKKVGSGGLRTAKKLWFRQCGAELRYAADADAAAKGVIPLLDVINVIKAEKPKCSFVLLTQERAWTLQCGGEDPESQREYWVFGLDLWLLQNRPGYKKLKQMDFRQPTSVARPDSTSGPFQRLAQRGSRSSDRAANQQQKEAEAEEETAPDGGAPVEISDSSSMLLHTWASRTVTSASLMYRRLLLSSSITSSAMADSTDSNSDMQQRIAQLERKRNALREQNERRERELAEVETTYFSNAERLQEGFKDLATKVSTIRDSALKAAFQDVQLVHSSLQAERKPPLDRAEFLQTLVRFQQMMPAMEALLQFNSGVKESRAELAGKIETLEAETMQLEEVSDELSVRLGRLESNIATYQQSYERMAAASSAMDQIIAHDPLRWLRDGSEAVEEHFRRLQSAMGAELMNQESEHLKLLLMETGSHAREIEYREDGSIKTASVRAFVELLINGKGKQVHVEYDDAILFGFHSFVAPVDLLERIILAYCSTLSGYKGDVTRATQIVRINRRRLLSILSKWLTYHAYDFQNKRLSGLTSNFLEMVQLSDSSKELALLVEKFSGNCFPAMPEFEASELPEDIHNFTFLDLSAREVARQLTRMDSLLFQQLETRDFLDAAWTNKNADVARSVKAVTKQFNEISHWVCVEILSEEDAVRRAKVIARFIDVAQCCFEYANFNGVLQIVGAIGREEVHRLKRTWALVPKESMRVVERHRALLQKNCSGLREAFASAKAPCMPYLGTYLTDLIMIGEMKTRVGDQYSYRKLQLQEKVLSQIMRRSEDSYNFPFRAVLQIVEYIRKGCSVMAGEGELRARSLQIEPRSTSLEKKKSRASLHHSRSRIDRVVSPRSGRRAPGTPLLFRQKSGKSAALMATSNALNSSAGSNESSASESTEAPASPKATGWKAASASPRLDRRSGQAALQTSSVTLGRNGRTSQVSGEVAKIVTIKKPLPATPSRKEKEGT